MPPAPSRYADRRASLATLHDKHPLVAPAMREVLGLAVFTVAVDTDAFGTFTGERERVDPPLVVAEKKARAGMAASDSSVGIATEGSIGSMGFVPLVTDHELVVLVDDEEGFVLAESAVSHDIIARSWTLSAGLPGDEDLHRAGFPGHGLIVRPAGSTGRLYKGIHDPEELRKAVDACRESGSPEVIIETDLRAHHCPSRRPTIAAAARRLAERLLRVCPACECPGWGPVDTVTGRKCAVCRHPTGSVLAVVDGCPRCNHRETGTPDPEPADPSVCDYCNP